MTKGAYDFGWWHNVDLLPLSAIDTSFYVGSNDQLQLTYTSNERHNTLYSDSSFALSLKVGYRYYHLEALAYVTLLPDGVPSRGYGHIVDLVTESLEDKIGQVRCQRTENGVICNFEFHNADQKVTLTKTYRRGELISIAGTLTTDDETISWEAIDMQAIAPPLQL